jgi:hypothetical protein
MRYTVDLFFFRDYTKQKKKKKKQTNRKQKSKTKKTEYNMVASVVLSSCFSSFAVASAANECASVCWVLPSHILYYTLFMGTKIEEVTPGTQRRVHSVNPRKQHVVVVEARGRVQHTWVLLEQHEF